MRGSENLSKPPSERRKYASHGIHCVAHRDSDFSADLAFNFGSDSHWPVRFVARCDGILGGLGSTRWLKNRMQDRTAVRASIDLLLEWDFDRIIVGHGQNIETAGKAALRNAFAFLK